MIACFIAGILAPFNIYAQWTVIGDAGGLSGAGASFNNLVIDNAGNYYISYYDLQAGKGSVQKYDGAGWNYVGGQGITSTFATYSGLAVDGNNVYYSFQDYSVSGRASVLKYGGTSWAYSIQGLSSSTINYQAFKRAPSGNLYLCYNNGSSGLTVQRFNGSVWTQLGNTGFTTATGTFLNLVAGSNDSIYVSCVTNGATAEVYKIHANASAGMAWEPAGITGFAASNSEQYRSSLAIDASNRLYLAYTSTSANGNKLNVRKYENGVWSMLGAADFSTGKLAHVSIAVTPSGDPFVAFQDWDASQKLTVMRFNGTQWERISPVDMATGVASFVSLAIDTDNKPVIAFSDAGIGKNIVMKYTGSFVSPVTDVEVTVKDNASPVINTDKGTLQVVANVLPSTVAQLVTWSIVPGTGTATITSDGLVTAQTDGTVWAKAVSQVDPAQADSVLITMTDQYDPYLGLDGVFSKARLWLKANTAQANKLVYNTGKRVTTWTDELSDYTVTSPSASQQPLLLTTPDAAANFNFNPSIKFNATAQNVLKLESATKDLLGQNGTLFIVVNTYGGANTSSTCLAYKGSTDNSRYQVKAHFRIQTGGINSSGVTSGYTSDFNNTNFVYSDISARLLASKGAGAGFYSKRNGVHTGITINDDRVYIPAVNLGICVGSNSNLGGTEYSNTAISEILMFNTPLTEDSITAVESYLAVKYGITLDPAVQSNYKASGGDVIWNGAVNNAYHFNITAVGRDDAYRLLQKQSRSVEQKALLYLYNAGTQGNFPDMNINNATSFTVDKSYLVAGDNNGDTSFVACYNAEKLSRIRRIWKVQKTGTVDSVTVALDIAAMPASLSRLLVSADQNFPDNNTRAYLLKRSNGKYYYTLPLNSGEYFTFAADSVHASFSVTNALCAGEASGAVNTTASNGAYPYTYAWSTTPVVNTANLTAVASGNYYVDIKDGGGCVTRYYVTVGESMKIETTVTSPTPDICKSSPATIEIASDNSTLSTYNWTPGNLTTAVISVTPAATTTYYVTGKDNKGCDYKDSITINVEEPINVAPVLTLTSQNGSAATFSWPPVNGATGYLVSTDGGNTYTVPSSGATGTTHTVSNMLPGQTVTLQVKATGSLDCQQSGWSNAVAVLYMVHDVFVPNAFTPNGDGKNDEVRVFGSAVKSVDFSIFNQWGQLIFRTSNQATGWNGTVNGKPQPSGVYMYVLKTAMADGTTEIKKGAINLVR